MQIFVFIDSQTPHTYSLANNCPLIELLEADVLSVLPEALPAKVQVVLPDEAMTVGAGTAETRNGIWMES